MLAKLTLGTRLFLSFLTVALITVVVGVVGYYGAVQGNRAVRQLGEESMPTVENLLVVKADTEAVGSIIRSLALPGLSVEQRNHLYKEVPALRERYGNALKAFQALPQNTRERALLQQLEPAIQTWRTENNRVLEICTKLDARGISDPAGLAAKIEQFTKDHLSVANRAMQLLLSNETFDGGTDAAECNCGKWLATFTTSNAALKSQVAALAEAHRGFHAAVAHVKTAAAGNNAAEARAAFEKELTPAMEEVFKHFDGLRATIADAGNLQLQVQEAVVGQVARNEQAVFGLIDQLVDSHRAGAQGEVRQMGNNAGFLKAFCLGAMIVGMIGAITMGYFITRSITGPIHRVAESLLAGSDQTASAAGQVSSASQSLAEGASEQAASLEETSSSLEELSSMTRRNADNASKATELAKKTRAAAEKGAEEMQLMTTAMSALKASSDETAKIVRTIDEIAFQTNILALNAAVEAARAGDAGMGFAVVADEVRNLAQRSAHAAKETSLKIEESLTRTSEGVAISQRVAVALGEITAQVREVDELVAEVAGASREQTHGITQINAAVGQMDKVTQGNAASAEESAAAAEQLNGQAATMKRSVVELSQLVRGAKADEIAAPSISSARADALGKQRVRRSAMQRETIVAAEPLTFD